jgi:hypothetical protein
MDRNARHGSFVMSLKAMQHEDARRRAAQAAWPVARPVVASTGAAAAWTPAACLSMVSLIFISAYGLANHLTHWRGPTWRGVFDWERAIPFVEWSIVPYLSILIFFVMSFYAGGGPQARRRHVLRLLILLALSVLCYAAFPLAHTFERPSTSGLTGALFELLWLVDLPYNRAPSLHIGVLVLLWRRLAPGLTPAGRLALGLWFCGIALSVLTTYQHHAIDLPAGLAAAWLSVALSRCHWLRRRCRVRATPQSQVAVRPQRLVPADHTPSTARWRGSAPSAARSWHPRPLHRPGPAPSALTETPPPQNSSACGCANCPAALGAAALPHACRSASAGPPARGKRCWPYRAV